MSERFGPNFAPGSFALQQSIRLVYTLRALSRGRNRAAAFLARFRSGLGSGLGLGSGVGFGLRPYQEPGRASPDSHANRV